MSDEWFPWYWSVYAANTLHLTPEQDGLYRRLIDWYMAHRQPPPDNDYALAGICRVGVDQWLQSAKVVRAFFKPRAGLLQHAFCNDALDAQDNKKTTRSKVSKHAADTRWGNIKGLDANSMPDASSTHAEPMLGNARGEERREKDKKETLPNGRSKRPPAQPRRKPMLPIEATWAPSEAVLTDALKEGFTEEEVAWHAERMRNHYQSKDERRADWNASFRNWIGKEKPRNGTGTINGHGNGSEPVSTGDFIEGLVGAFAREARQRNEDGRGSAPPSVGATEGGHAGFGDAGQADELFGPAEILPPAGRH